MDSKDRTPQEDIIELIDIIEEGEESVSTSLPPEETPEELEDLEDLFLFPGASEASRSLLDEMDDKGRGGDDNFPELDAIFEDLQSIPESATEPLPQAVEVPQPGELLPLESRIASLEARMGSLPDVNGIRSEIDMARESVLREVGIEGVRSRIAELQERIPARDEIVRISEVAAGEALATRLDRKGETSELSMERVQDLVSASVQEATEPWGDLLEEQAEELARINRELESVRDSIPTRETVAAMIEQAVQEAETTREARISKLESELATLQGRFAEQEAAPGEPDMTALLKEMDARIEKAVPSAAARIIREEIAALLKG